MNPEQILALLAVIADLRVQVGQLSAEREQLVAAITQLQQAAEAADAPDNVTPIHPDT